MNSNLVSGNVEGGNHFDEEYYTGNGSKSNYKNYFEKKFDGLAEDLISHFGIKKSDRVIDFGCAAGGLINELFLKGFKNVYGTDISPWSIEKGRELYGLSDKTLQHYNRELLNGHKNYLLLLDVLEHLPSMNEIDMVLTMGSRKLKNQIIVRIPVSKNEGENFFLDCSRNDKTHYQCHSKEWWIDTFSRNGLRLDQRIDLKNIYDSTGVFCASFKKT